MAPASALPLRIGRVPLTVLVTRPPRHLPHPLAAVNGGFLSPIWAVFGMIDLPSYSGATAFVLWIYSLAGVVLLINTLIAMLSLTYSEVHDQAELEYLLVRCERTLTHMNIVHRVRRRGGSSPGKGACGETA